MKKTFKNLILTSMLFLGSVFAHNADAGYWIVSYCKSDPVGTYSATYTDLEGSSGLIIYELEC